MKFIGSNETIQMDKIVTFLIDEQILNKKESYSIIEKKNE